VKRSHATRHYLITRGESLDVIAQARSLWVFVNLQTNSIMRLPSVFLEDFITHIAAK